MESAYSTSLFEDRREENPDTEAMHQLLCLDLKDRQDEEQDGCLEPQDIKLELIVNCSETPHTLQPVLIIVMIFRA